MPIARVAYFQGLRKAGRLVFRLGMPPRPSQDDSEAVHDSPLAG
ncbi:hypothetical protein [Oxalobacter vibrioformis]|nr:hypothetical protein [Oxalobacter vibrioformis]